MSCIPWKIPPKTGMRWTRFAGSSLLRAWKGCWGRSSAHGGGTGDTPQPPSLPTAPQCAGGTGRSRGSPARSEPHGAEGLSESLRLPPGPGERSSHRRCVPAGAAGASAPSCCCCCSVSWGRGSCLRPGGSLGAAGGKASGEVAGAKGLGVQVVRSPPWGGCIRWGPQKQGCCTVWCLGMRLLSAGGGAGWAASTVLQGGENLSLIC